MDIHRRSRLCAAALALPILWGHAPGAPAALLARFDFDDAGGGFTLDPDFLAPGLTLARWGDALDLLADFAGNPGRALASSGFTNGNRFVLVLALTPGWQLQDASLDFQLRGSASGPRRWRLEAGGTAYGEGTIGSVFAPYHVALGGLPGSGAWTLDLLGLDATATSGTLRLDNAELHGELTSVPLPGAWFLVLTPLLGHGLGRLARHRR